MISTLGSLVRKISSIKPSEVRKLSDEASPSVDVKTFSNDNNLYVKSYSTADSTSENYILCVFSPVNKKDHNFRNHLVLTVRNVENDLDMFSIFRSVEIHQALFYYEQWRQYQDLFKYIPEFGAIAFLSKLTDAFTCHPHWTSLHIAAKLGITEYFEQTSRSFDIRSCPEGWNPLFVAVRYFQVETAKRLIEMKVSLRDLDQNGNNIFHLCSNQDEELLELIYFHIPNADELLVKTNNDGRIPCFKKHSLTSYKVNELSRMNTARRKASASAKAPNALLEVLTKKSLGLREMELLLNNNTKLLNEIERTTGNHCLHMATQKKSLLSLLELKDDELEKNPRNNQGKTPLHVYAQKSLLGPMMALYGYHADVNLQDQEGNTPLHYAVLNRDKMMIKLLLCIGSDTNRRNNAGETPRHLAAKDADTASEIIYMLVLRGARPCCVDMSGCSPGCVHPQHQAALAMHHSVNDHEISLEDLLYEHDLAAREMSDPYAYTITKHLEIKEIDQDDIAHKRSLQQLFRNLRKQRQHKGHPRIVNILALDGGGVKGFVLVQILLAIEELLDRPLAEYFDWTAATSTGSCVGANAAVGNCVREGQRIYLRFKDDVFGQRTRPYNALTLEKFYKKVFGAERTMNDVRGKNFFCTVTVADRAPAKLELLRNYDSVIGNTLDYGNTSPSDILIWQAIRRSCAAPTYFAASEGKYIDGGLSANNPTMDLLSEIHHWNTHSAPDDQIRIGCVLSVGTGVVDPISVEPSQFEMSNTLGMIKGMKNLIQTVMTQATATDGAVVTRSRAWSQSIGAVYYRVSPNLSKDYAMDGVEDTEIISMMWDCVEFGWTNRKLLEEIAEVLQRVGPSKNLQKISTTNSEPPLHEGVLKGRKMGRVNTNVRDRA